MRCRATITALLSHFALWVLLTNSVWAQGSRSIAREFLQQHCGACHDEGTSEGGFALDALTNDLADEANFARWERVHDRILDGEMPPPEETPPPPQDISKFLKSISSALTQTHAAHKETVLRRLNRAEYQNTLNDLFGTNLNLGSMLPADGRAHEFENVGSALSISMVQLDTYMRAVEQVFDASIETYSEPIQPTTLLTSYAETREAKTHLGKAWRLLDDGAVVFFRRLGYPTGMLRTARAKTAGYYRIRIRGYAFQSDKPITFQAGATTFQRGAEKPTFGYYEMPPTESTIELVAWFEQNHMLEITPWGISDPNYEIKKNGIEKYEGPGLAILDVEMHGPVRPSFPSKGHKLLFQQLSRVEIEPSNPSIKSKPWYKPSFEIQSKNVEQDSLSTLEQIAAKAFRRPVTTSEITPFHKLFMSEYSESGEFETALRTAASAIFCSPEFLYLQESPGWLDDYQLAARLSYFLTRTGPDDELLQLASQGKLSRNRDTLLAQTRRLLKDQRHARFIKDFTDAWLHLRDINFTSPDKALFPEYDEFLQWSLLEESHAFLEELIASNAPVRSLVKSDFAMLNNRLADHYDLPPVEGPEIRRVQLPSDSLRGGVITQGSILKVSANGTNTSPVRRGVWLSEAILGITPQPPPPGIPGVEPDIRGADTLRELLAKHRSQSSCNSCHNKIDPPGFALECFNPIGGFRDRYRSLGEGEKVNLQIDGRRVRYRLAKAVDCSGAFGEGNQFKNFVEFRDQLASKEAMLAQGFVRKLATFATGRELGFSDRRVVDQIVEQAKNSDFGIQNLLESVVTSEIFRRK